jgi:hypothetical protein
MRVMMCPTHPRLADAFADLTAALTPGPSGVGDGPLCRIASRRDPWPRWADIEFANGLIYVEQSWDDKAGPIEPKESSGLPAR